MQKHVPDEDIFSQGLPLILSLINSDGQSKMNLSKTRQLSLNCGIVDVMQQVQRQYRGNKNLQVVCKCILDLLVTEYS
jgi:hypothetical protein